MKHSFTQPDSGEIPKRRLKFKRVLDRRNTLTQKIVDKILLGVLPLAVWNEYVATARKMGIDEAVKIVQAAVDRFNNRR